MHSQTYSKSIEISIKNVLLIVRAAAQDYFAVYRKGKDYVFLRKKNPYWFEVKVSKDLFRKDACLVIKDTYVYFQCGCFYNRAKKRLSVLLCAHFSCSSAHVYAVKASNCTMFDDFAKRLGFVGAQMKAAKRVYFTDRVENGISECECDIQWQKEAKINKSDSVANKRGGAVSRAIKEGGRVCCLS